MYSEIDIATRLNPNDYKKITDFMDLIGLKSKYISLKPHNELLNRVNYKYNKFIFEPHSEFDFMIHKYGNGTFAVKANPIGPKGRDFFPELGFDAEDDSKTVMVYFKEWASHMRQMQDSYEHALKRENLNNAQEILQDHFALIDDESAKVIINLQEKTDEMQLLISNLIQNYNELKLKINNEYFTREEVIEKIRNLKAEIEAESKKFNIGSFFLKSISKFVAHKVLEAGYDSVNVQDILHQINAPETINQVGPLIA